MKFTAMAAAHTVTTCPGLRFLGKERDSTPNAIVVTRIDVMECSQCSGSKLTRLGAPSCSARDCGNPARDTLKFR